MNKFGLHILSILLIILLFAPASLLAERGVPVSEKSRPDYEPPGIRQGAFTIKPSLTTGGEYNDNIYAEETNEESDWIMTVAPRVSVGSNWSRHSLGLDAGLKGGFYASESDEDYLDGYVSVDGRADVQRNSFFTARAGFEHDHEERGDTDVNERWDEPGRYYRTTGSMAYEHGINRVKVIAGTGITNLNYQRVDLVDGTSDSQELRDRNEYNINGRVSYELLPNVQPFVISRYEVRRYDESAAERDSQGTRIGVGTGLNLGGVTTIEVYAGHMRQDYDDRSTIDGFWYGVDLLWNPTRLTSVQATVESSIKETLRADSSGIDALDAGLRVDHELLRNLVVGAFFDYTDHSYKDIDLTENYYEFGPRVTYYWNRNLSAEAGYTYRRRDSDLDGLDYTENRYNIEITAGF